MQDFLNFLETSPTFYHAKKNISYFLAEHDFSPLEMKEKWNLEKNQGYFVSFGSLLIAFRMPETMDKMAIIANHLDSPGFKLKPNSAIKGKGFSKLATAVYGSPIFSTWTNRKLGLAGKVIHRDKSGSLKSSLVNLNQHPLMIPQPAIHIERKANEKGVDPLHLTPLCSLEEEKGLKALLSEYLPFDSLLDFDLYLYPIEKPSFIGLNQEMIGSYRLDNLASAYSCMKALVDSSNKDTLLVSIFFNHEEIGSRTAEGAFSPLFNQLLQKLTKTYDELISLKQQALCISCDVSHAFDCTYMDKFDEANAPLIGKGTAIKYDSQQAYATTIEAAARLVDLAEKNKLSLQKYHVKSDTKSGSTIGNIFASTTGISTIDIGIPCFSMHAANEIIAVKDLEDQTSLLKAFLREPFSLELDHD